MINQIEHNEVKSSQISENEVVGSKDSSGTIIHGLLKLCYFLIYLLIDWVNSMVVFVASSIENKFSYSGMVGYEFSAQQTQ